MASITFISTVHKKIGKCSAEELCKILEKITPDIIFLEALEDTYSKYHQNTFSNFGVFHEKLEIKFSYIGISQKGGSIFKTTQDIFLPNKYGRVKGFLNDDKYSIRHLREIDVMNHLPQVKKNLEIVINTFMEENNVDFIDLFELTEKSLKRHIKLNKIIK